MKRVSVMCVSVAVALSTNWFQASAPPESPRVLIDTTYTLPTGPVTAVNAGGDLQSALNSAPLNSTLVLAAGATFTGHFTLPAKTGSGWIYVVSSALASLPTGNRVGPSQAAFLPKIVSPDTTSVLVAAGGAHHFWFAGIELATTWASTTATHYNLIDIEGAHDLTFDRCYIHGTATGNVRRGVTANGAAIAVVDSTIADIHEIGADSQAFDAWDGPGPFKIVNNQLEGAGENVMFGGAPPSSPAIVPSDIEIRGNHFYKPLAWKALSWSVKNLLEFKDAQRALVEGNIFENNWPSAQNGFSILFTPRSEGGAALGVVSDVTIRRNRLVNVAQGWNIGGYDDTGPSLGAFRIVIRDNVYDVVGGGGSDGRGLQIVGGPRDLVIDHNTGFAVGGLGVSEDFAPHQVTGFVFTNNLEENSGIGFGGTGTGPGTSTLATHYIAPVFTSNGLIASPCPDYCHYPAGNFFPVSVSAVGFVNQPGGNYALLPTSPYKNAGTDGKDLGADIDALTLATTCAVTGACGGVAPPVPVPVPVPVPTPTPAPKPVDCVMSVWKIGTNSATTVTLTRTVTTAAANGGAACGPTSISVAVK